MTVYEQISADLKEAMKAGDAFRRDVVRLMQSAIKNVAIDKRVTPAEMDDDSVLEVLKRLVKQRKDSIEQYLAGGREDLAATEQQELEVIAAYLPAEMDDATLKQVVTDALAAAGFSQKSDMGKAMGAAMQAVAGKASGDRVKQIVGDILV
jgi:uncharacterized protein YqeY